MTLRLEIDLSPDKKIGIQETYKALRVLMHFISLSITHDELEALFQWAVTTADCVTDSDYEIVEVPR